MVTRRGIVAALCALLVLLASVTTAAAAEVSSVPVTTSSFAKGVSTHITTWHVINTQTESRDMTQQGACEAQTLSWTEERTITTTTYYVRTVQHQGMTHSSGKLLSDTTGISNVTVETSAWTRVGDVAVSGTCGNNGQGHAGTGNSGIGQGGTNGGNGTANEGNGPGANNGNGGSNNGK